MNQPLAKISVYTHLPKKLSLTKEIKNQVGNIMNIAAKVNGIIKEEKKIVLKFNEEITKRLQAGELHLVNKKDGSGVLAIAADIGPFTSSCGGHPWRRK